MNIQDKLTEIINENLNDYSPIKWKLRRIDDLTEICTDDPGNEMLFMAMIDPDTEDEDFNLNDLDQPINSRKFSDLITSHFTGDHYAEMGEPLTMNNMILLPIILLK